MTRRKALPADHKTGVKAAASKPVARPAALPEPSFPDLERLLHSWPGVIFRQRADFSFEYVNDRIEDLTGIAPAVWLKQPSQFWEVVHEADIDELKRQCAQSAQTSAGVTTTYRLRHARTGSISYVLEHRQATVDKSGLPMVYQGFWLDVTRQTLGERRLSAAAWKGTFALVTMGLLHDFNNQLCGILSLTELVLSQRGGDDPAAPALNQIRQGIMLASRTVQRIADLHHSKPGGRQYLDFNQVVAELVELVSKVMPRRIQVRTELPQGQLPVYMDVVKFRQVVLDLALNAADAMPQHGELIFSVEVHTTKPPRTHCQGKFPTLPCLCLSVRDNGAGIAPRHLPHIFDPFFTTKPGSKGSGLGLCNARSVVEEHGGAISVDSTEGAGATFHLWLPQADFTEAEREAAKSAESRRRVLLVGQPGLATENTAELLRANNFHVVATRTPARALELLASEGGSLRGVIIAAAPGDAVMLSLVSELRERRLVKHIILQIIGGNADQVEHRILKCASLVLAGGAVESLILQKLNQLFSLGHS